MWSGKPIQTRIEFSIRVEEQTTRNSHYGTIGVYSAFSQTFHLDPAEHFWRRTGPPNPTLEAR